MKLILGCAAFSGQPYGRNITAVPTEEVDRIIESAIACGITAFDTSPAYGMAENRLCKFLTKDMTVYSKHPHDAKPRDIYTSLGKLLPATVVLLAHNLEYERDLPAWAAGYSGYAIDTPREPGPIAQLDCSIINRDAVDMEMDIICRSVFAQGVLCGVAAPNKVVEDMQQRAHDLADVLNIPLPALALQWALQQENIKGVVIGPTSVSELLDIVAWSKLTVQPLKHFVELLPSDSAVMDCRTWKEAVCASG